MLLSGGGELRARAHDRGGGSELREQARLRSGAADERVEAAGSAELRGGHAGQLLRRVGEGTEAGVCGARARGGGAGAGVGPEVERAPLEGEALERRAPVADAALGPAVE